MPASSLWYLADSFEPDFYNNVAAVSVVLMFTRIVAHGMRKARKADDNPGTGCANFVLNFLHAVTVIAAVVGLAAALMATSRRKTDVSWIVHLDLHCWSWAGLGVATVCMIGTLLVEACEDRSNCWCAQLRTWANRSK